MAFGYHFTKDPIKLGNYDDTYGQAWWGDVAEMAYPVKFNVMSRDSIDMEDSIECEEQVMKKSAKGKEYYQLKKVKVHKAYGNASAAQPEPQASPETPDRPAPKADSLLLERIVKQQTIIIEKLNLLLGSDEEDI
jgi:hypothetical protein